MDRTTRDAILALADVVHAQARASIHLHNKIERAQNTGLSFIKNLLGWSRIGFEEFAQDSAEMNAEWKQILWQVALTEQRLQQTMSDQERDYFRLIRGYAEANATAAALLSERQAAFFEASKSYRRSTLTYDTTRKLTCEYDDAVTRCQRLFQELKHASFVFLSPSNAREVDDG